jgi:tetratricopeptide (TPR) repeat protein
MKPKPQEENPLLADLVDYRAGLQMLKEGRVDEAIQILVRARASHPTDPKVPNALGLALLAKKDEPAAVKAFSDALKLDPGSSESRNNRGVAYTEMGKLDLAEADFQAVIEGGAAAERNNARFNLGLVEKRRERWENAEREFSLVLSADPRSSRAFRERGLVRVKRGDYKSALKDFLEVLKDEPKDPISNYQAALCLLTAGRRDLALRYMERTASAAPDSDEGKRARRFLDSEPADSAPSVR